MMIKSLNYDQYCKRYALDSTAEESKTKHEKFCKKLTSVLSLFAEKTTSEALAKAKAATK